MEKISVIRVGGICVEFKRVGVEKFDMEGVAVGFYLPHQSVTIEDCWEDFMGMTGIEVPQQEWGLEGEWEYKGELEDGTLSMWERAVWTGGSYRNIARRSIYRFTAKDKAYSLSLSCYDGADVIGKYEGLPAPLTQRFSGAEMLEGGRWLRDKMVSAIRKSVSRMVDGAVDRMKGL